MQQPLTKKQSKASLASGSSGLDLNKIVRAKLSWFEKIREDDSLLSRTSTHIIVMAVVMLTIGLSHTHLFQTRTGVIHPLKQNTAAPLEPPPPEEANEGSLLGLPTNLNNFIDGVFRRAAVPRTVTQTETETEFVRSNEIATYVVGPGDTVFGIAAKYGLAPETIMWSNPTLENNPDLLSLGQELTILPVDGVYHQVGASDTVESIASTFKTDPELIINHPLNELNADDVNIQAGQWLIVPGGEKPFVPRTVTAYTGPIPDDALGGSGSFAWPATGTIYQGYWSAHPGIDIAGWSGQPVLAADAGYVVAAGWDNTGYGYSVFVDHGNGYQTLYAHLQAYYVDAGENVVQGQQIGEVGSTGNATGPHLHFEVRQGTVQRNPIGFLP